MRLIKIGTVIHKTGRIKKGIAITREFEVYRDMTERDAYEKCRHLPHNGDREKSRRMRQMGLPNEGV